MSRAVQLSSKNPNHITPHSIVEIARYVMGGIDLDPCSSPLANTVVKALMFYTPEDNGLVQPWGGRVYCNPPGGQLQSDLYPKGIGPKGTHNQQALWWAHANTQWRLGEIDQACFLVFNFELFRYAQRYLPDVGQPLEYPYLLFAERPQFLHPDTAKPQTEPGHPCALIWLPPGSHDARLRERWLDATQPFGHSVCPDSWRVRRTYGVHTPRIDDAPETEDEIT